MLNCHKNASEVNRIHFLSVKYNLCYQGEIQMAGEFVADECEAVDAVGVDRMNRSVKSPCFLSSVKCSS